MFHTRVKAPIVTYCNKKINSNFKTKNVPHKKVACILHSFPMLAD